MKMTYRFQDRKHACTDAGVLFVIVFFIGIDVLFILYTVVSIVSAKTRKSSGKEMRIRLTKEG